MIRRLAPLVAFAALSACMTTGPDVRTAPDAATPITGARTEAGAPDFALPPVTPPPREFAAPAIEAGHVHSLPELIDIAQRTNPLTQAAWERAREAAAAVDIVESAYLPQLSANILAGYGRTSSFAPAVPPLLPDGRFTVDGLTVTPNVAFEWLLFDFGRRDAARQIAEEATVGANVVFQGAHQRVIFEVASAYYRYNAAREDTRIARARVADARTLRAMAVARRDAGLGTEVDVAQTRQIEARTRFELTLAENRERDGYARLMRAMGLDPTTRIEVTDLAGRRLPADVPVEIETLIEEAVARRPDIQAALAAVRASEAGMALAAAERRPAVLAVGEAGRAYGRFRLDDDRLPGSARVSDSLAEAAVGVLVRMPLFDGGLRDAQERRAQARAAVARRDLDALRAVAATEIVEAYDLLRSSLAAHAASGPLLAAANEAYAAVLGFYDNGLATLAEVSVAKTAVNDARMVRADAFADAFIAAAALAFATGDLTSVDAVP